MKVDKLIVIGILSASFVINNVFGQSDINNVNSNTNNYNTNTIAPNPSNMQSFGGNQYPPLPPPISSSQTLPPSPPPSPPKPNEFDEQAGAELFTSPEITKETVKDVDKYERARQGLSNIRISLTPKIENIKTIKKIYLHPNYIVTINIDPVYEILYAKSSFKTKLFDVIDNTIQIQPDDTLREGSIAILVKNKSDNKRFLLNILAKRYIPYIENIDKDEPLALVVYFVDNEILPPIKVIELFYQLNKRYPSDGDVLYYNGIGYKIIENNRFWDIAIGKKTYRITPFMSKN